MDSGGNPVDSVLFDDSDPWPSEPDGNGPSLELKSPELDNNDGANWQFSGGTTGVIINGNEVKGTPGAANSGGGTPGPAVTIDLANFAFNPSIVVVKVGDIVRWVNNEIIEHNVNGHQDDFPDNPDSFLSGPAVEGPWQYDFEFLIPGTYDFQCDPHAGSGMVGKVYVYDPLAYTDFPLSALRLTNSNGQALFNGVPTEVTAVVHGVNFQPTGYSFYVINQNNLGINVFSFDPGAYVVTEGDEVKVSGVIAQFNGLLEMLPDAIEVLSSGNALNIPRYVTEITETDESSYLTLDELLVDSVGNITAAGFNVYTTHTSGKKVLVRVDEDANTGRIPEDFPEMEWLYVWEGIGSQFDSSFPFTDGYQVLALGLGVIIDEIQFLPQTTILMSPNPAMDMLQFASDELMQTVEIYSMDGKKELQHQLQNTTGQISITGLTNGLHVVKVTTDAGVWTSVLSVIK
jgi:plastocyanin